MDHKCLRCKNLERLKGPEEPCIVRDGELAEGELPGPVLERPGPAGRGRTEPQVSRNFEQYRLAVELMVVKAGVTVILNRPIGNCLSQVYLKNRLRMWMETSFAFPQGVKV